MISPFAGSSTAILKGWVSRMLTHGVERKSMPFASARLVLSSDPELIYLRRHDSFAVWELKMVW